MTRSLFEVWKEVMQQGKESTPDYAVSAPRNTWTTISYYKPRVQFYFCSRPGKRWKK